MVDVMAFITLRRSKALTFFHRILDGICCTGHSCLPRSLRTVFMSKSIKSLLLVAAFVISGISQSLAQAPSGVTTNFISGATAPVYDLTGSYPLNQTVSGVGGTPINLSFQVDIVQGVQGQLRNPGNILLVGIGTNSTVAGIYSLSGRILTIKGETHAKFTVHIHNTDVVAGVNTPFNINLRYDLIVSPGTLGLPGSMSGTARGSAQLGGFGSGKILSDVSVSLPALVDGSWNLSMNILPLGHLSGTGTVTLSNSRRLQMRLNGNFSEATGISKVNLNGVQGSQGNTLHVEFLTSTNGVQIQRLKGHLFGQQVQE